MHFHQKRFFPFQNGAPSIHSLRTNLSKTQVIVTTDRSVHGLRWRQHGGYHLEELSFMDAESEEVDVIGSGIIECAGRERVAVAYGEQSDSAESASGESTDKMYLSIIDPHGSENVLAAADPASSNSIRFELVAAPTTITSVRAQSFATDGGTAIFHGVLVFRMDSVIAFGFVDESENSPTTQCVRLSNEQFAAFFPEFAQFSHPVLSVDVHMSASENRGWIAFGCANGFIRVYAGSVRNGCLSGPYETRDFHMNGPVMAVSLFVTTREQHETCNLLAACAIGQAVIYEDVFAAAPAQVHQETLDGSDLYDSIFSAVAADIDLDGHAELLIGTDDQALLAYKRTNDAENLPQDPPRPTILKSAEAESSTKHDALIAANSTAGGAPPHRWSRVPKNEWEMRAFGGVYSLAWLDLNDDGVNELIIASSTGVYIYEADPTVVLAKLEALLASISVST